METPIIISTAERMYKHHLKAVSNYQKRNPEKTREKVKRYMVNLKSSSPEKYKNMLEKQRAYYHQVAKPRNRQRKLDDRDENQTKSESPDFMTQSGDTSSESHQVEN